MSFRSAAFQRFFEAIALFGALDTSSMSGAVQLTALSGRIQRLDPNGTNRTVTLPGPTQDLDESNGHWFLFQNTADATELLQVKDPGGTNLVDLERGNVALVWGTSGTGWVVLFGGHSTPQPRPIVLTVNGESADVITVDVDSPVRNQALIAEVYYQNMVEALAAAFTLAETGAGTGVSTTGNARLYFRTDGSGAAQISVTDVVGGSAQTVFLIVYGVAQDAGETAPAPAIRTLTFDAV